ncbi:hypothetical protein Prudu_013174 [Prunus dulcis]|uniref:Uncharacterized protein n=1 Tax=Prunus dulcis TaxID=3755 RepID=A0A4Y1RES8_PRUDU|nr:hypothetical protein Prudu_013174 [Prunus dulcis]
MVVLSHIIGHESLQPLSWISLITSSAYSENGNCPLHKESDWKEAGYHDHGSCVQGILLAEELKGGGHNQEEIVDEVKGSSQATSSAQIARKVVVDYLYCHCK